MSPKKSTELSSGDTPKTPKVWEKARREKMRIYFNELQEVLPLYDPSAPMSRFEILQKSRIYIRDLQSQNQDLLNGGFDEVYKSKMEKLKQRVKELLQRVDQLTDLLRRANIMIPPLIPFPDRQDNVAFSQKWMNQRPKKWTEKINVVVPDEKIENILSLIKDFKKKNGKVSGGKKTCKMFEKQCDNGQNGCLTKKATFSERLEMRRKKQLKRMKNGKVVSRVVDLGKTEEKTNSETFAASQSPSHTKENQPVDFNLPNEDEPNGKATESDDKDKTDEDKSKSKSEANAGSKAPGKGTAVGDGVGLVTGKVKNVIESQGNVFLPSATNVVQSNAYILTNDGNLVQFPILNSSGNVFTANSNLLTQAAIVNQSNSGILTPLVINRPSPVIVLQKPAPQIIQAAQIVNPTPQILSVPNQNIQILGNPIVCATSSQSTGSKALPYILSKQPANKKRIAKDSTMTTYVNKIPIPALSKQSYVKKPVSLATCVGSKGKAQPSKGKESKEKSTEDEKGSGGECDRVVQVNEKEIQTDKFAEEPSSSSSSSCDADGEKAQRVEDPSKPSETCQKRSAADEENANGKKRKGTEKNSDSNVFKPIDNPLLSESHMGSDGLFCNLKLPNAVSHNLSVSPTAAFLSTFPIVASSKFEVDDELTGKLDERRHCEEKDGKLSGSGSSSEKELPAELSHASKSCDLPSSGDVALAVKEPPRPALTLTDEKACDPDKRQMIEANCSADVNAPNSNMVSSGSIARNIPGNSIGKDGGGGGVSANANGNAGTVASDISNGNECTHLVSSDKAWEDYQQAKNCDVRTDPFYISSDLHNPVPAPSIPDITNSMGNFSDAVTGNAMPYKGPYPQNNMKATFNDHNSLPDQSGLKSNPFEYGQKENFAAKRMNYSNERSGGKKPCNALPNESYGMGKNQAPMYQAADPGPNYQLIPVKEMTSQRNTRAPVNWMTDPDVRTRSMSYSGQPEKMTPAKIPTFTQPDIFYPNNQAVKPQAEVPADYILADVNKMNYQKNDFYGSKEPHMKAPEQRYKAADKRPDGKFPAKPPQNSYNIFDYNYNGNYFAEDESNKYCAQGYQPNVKSKKNNSVGLAKKKDASLHLIPSDQHNDPGKRNPEQILPNVDFNPVGNQECFSWVPGKNVDWLPSKSFVDTNLILPSTLPTLVGDLALGTTTSNEASQSKGGVRMSGKTASETSAKNYPDLSLANNGNFGKAVVEPVADAGNGKQYLEPFANLSKNIFDLTPGNNVQNPQLSKTDCEKNAYLGSANETIVLKNIFELPVSKSFANDFPNRNKQRTVNNTQNTFLSVSQLVETPNYESNSIKSEAAMDNVSKQGDTYPAQNYGGYHQKAYKGKARNSHYKYNDRKYQGYNKNVSSNYTAEALIRSNANLTYQNSDYQSDVNSNFYPGKTNQKADGYPVPARNDFEKADFVPCSTQNIYADFNFSSPVSNFNISTSVAGEYVSHDGNFTAQNNFFGDFIPPEYPITESVSNSLLLPPCSIALQNPFIMEKRNSTPDKGKSQGKPHTYGNSRSRKGFDCSKTSYSDFSIGHATSSGIFTTSSITCPSIFTTTSCQNLLPVPAQNDPNITFSASSFSSGNIAFPPPLTSNANANYHGGPGPGVTASGFFPSGCPAMFTTSSTTTVSSARTCPTSGAPSTSSAAVITSSFSVGCSPFPSSTQSALPFFSLSNPIIPPSVPSTSGNSLANFNLSTIFPEINQKGNYHYP